MTQYDMLDAKTNLSKLIKSLEDKKEDVIVIARNGVPVADITLHKEKKRSIIGCAKDELPKIDMNYLENDEDEIISLFDKDKGLF